MTEKIKKYAEQKASGSTFLEISGKGLAAGELAFPALQEQRRIGTLFSRLDSLITLHQRESPAGAPRPQNVAARSILEGGVAPASDSIKKWCNGRIVHGEASK